MSGKGLRSVTPGAARSLTRPVATTPGQGRAGVNAAPCWSALPGGLRHYGDLPNGTGYLSVRNCTLSVQMNSRASSEVCSALQIS